MNKVIVASILVIAFGAPSAPAATMVQKAGPAVGGTIMQENGAASAVKTDDTWQTIGRRKLNMIARDDVQAAPPAEQPPSSAAPEPPASAASTRTDVGREGSGFYFGVQALYNRIGGEYAVDGTMKKVDPGFGVGLILGYSFDRSFALELDLAGSSHTSAGADIAFGEFSLNTKISMPSYRNDPSPFLLAGIGSFTIGDDSLTFGGTGYNLGFGVAIPLSEKSSFGFAFIWKFITYDEIVTSNSQRTLSRDIESDTTSIRFDLLLRF